RDHGVLALFGAGMAVQAVDLVNAYVHFVRVVNGLLRHIALLASQADSAIDSEVTAYNEQHYNTQGDVGFIAVKRYRLRGSYAFFISSQLIQVAVDLHQYQRYNGQYQGNDTEQQAVVA